VLRNVNRGPRPELPFKMPPPTSAGGVIGDGAVCNDHGGRPAPVVATFLDTSAPPAVDEVPAQGTVQDIEAWRAVGTERGCRYHQPRLG
jgi:hypothetical protein